MGLAVAEHDQCADRGARERRQLRLSGLHRPAVRRSEHPEPLEHDPLGIDARQELLCQNIKADKTNPVMVFTIQVNIGNADPKSQVLQDCATAGNFQMITSSTQTSDAFKNVLTQISKLRVSK